MQQQTPYGRPQPERARGHNVSGDLRVAGWDRGELMAKTDGDTLDLAAGSDPITIACDEDLILYLPRGANLQVERVAGDAEPAGPAWSDYAWTHLRRPDHERPRPHHDDPGSPAMHPCGNVGALSAENVSGDFVVRGVPMESCAIDNVGGDASLRDVDGMVTIQKVGLWYLYLRNVHGAADVTAGADVALYVDPKPGQTYDVTAGNDLIVRLSPRTETLRLHLTAGSPKSLHPGGLSPAWNCPRIVSECQITIGAETAGMAEMVLTAGDDLLVTSQADKWESAADFGVGMGDGLEWPLPPDFSERINRRVQAAMDRAQAHLDAANRHAKCEPPAGFRENRSCHAPG